MNGVFREDVVIYEEFKKILQSGIYEQYILELMNSSKYLFPNSYKHISSQSKGECDFVDEKTSRKYDAKLALSQEQCRLICSRQGDLEKWIMSLWKELEEFYHEVMVKGVEKDISGLTLYKIMYEEIARDKTDENIIFFIPFTIIKESSSMVFQRFGYDILTAIYDEIKKTGVLLERKIYVLYFGIENEVVFRCLNNNKREYFSNTIFSNLIKYHISV